MLSQSNIFILFCPIKNQAHILSKEQLLIYITTGNRLLHINNNKPLLMIEKIDLSLLQVFVLAAKADSFTKTAEILKVSRSHISRQINQLEKNLGITLFKRSTRRLKLTKQGSQLLLICQDVLKKLDSNLIKLISDTSAPRGHLKINSVGGYIGETLIATICQEFTQQYPLVMIELDFSSTRIDLIESEFSVAFRMGELQDASYIARPILTVPMRTLASPSYLQQYGQPQTPKDLISHNCITGTISKWHYQHKINKKANISIEATGNLKCKNGRVMVESALKGLGIIRVPQCYCSENIIANELVEIFDDWYIPDVQLSMIYHKDLYPPKSLQLFIEFAVNHSWSSS